MPDSDPDDACAVAMRAALDQALTGEYCGDEATKMRETGKLFGVEEPDADCEAALAEGFDAETCRSGPGLRQLVMCLIWNESEHATEPLIEKYDGDFREASNEAWRIADEQCESVEG